MFTSIFPATVFSVKLMTYSDRHLPDLLVNEAQGSDFSQMNLPEIGGVVFIGNNLNDEFGALICG